MPVYEFCCKKCKNRFEDLIFKKSELDTIICPKCGGKDVERLFSIFGFCSKGSNGETSSAASSCTGCQRTSCAGCK